MSVVECERKGETQEEKTGYFSYSLAKILKSIVLSVDKIWRNWEPHTFLEGICTATLVKFGSSLES